MCPRTVESTPPRGSYEGLSSGCSATHSASDSIPGCSFTHSACRGLAGSRRSSDASSTNSRWAITSVSNSSVGSPLPVPRRDRAVCPARRRVGGRIGRVTDAALARLSSRDHRADDQRDDHDADDGVNDRADVRALLRRSDEQLDHDIHHECIVHRYDPRFTRPPCDIHVVFRTHRAYRAPLAHSGVTRAPRAPSATVVTTIEPRGEWCPNCSLRLSAIAPTRSNSLTRPAGSLQDDGISSSLHLLDVDVAPDVDAATLVVSLGGDGTFLKSARLAHAVGARVSAVNLGRLGFLLNVPSDEVVADAKFALSGDDVVDRLALSISVSGTRRGRVRAQRGRRRTGARWAHGACQDLRRRRRVPRPTRPTASWCDPNGQHRLQLLGRWPGRRGVVAGHDHDPGRAALHDRPLDRRRRRQGDPPGRPRTSRRDRGRRARHRVA